VCGVPIAPMTSGAQPGIPAARARRELLATGETVRKRVAEASDTLTAQEAQVARLARDGLFISSRTVQYRLHKVFTKLGISSRSQLHQVLPSDPDPGQSA
jgi:DNA-binding CsgD family transcriptional regulator